ncbi:MAG: azurin [Bacteroidota bacterium]
MKRAFILPLLIAILFLTSCGGGASDGAGTTTMGSEVAMVQESTAGDEDVTLELESNDQMQYNKKELSVQAGQRVKLVLKHVGQMSKVAMGHNFVLLKPGTDLGKFGLAAMSATDNEYIPRGSKAVIAYTKMIGGGESTSVTFDAPAKGTYDYICSFPGHYGIMQGKFIVQ